MSTKFHYSRRGLRRRRRRMVLTAKTFLTTEQRETAIRKFELPISWRTLLNDLARQLTYTYWSEDWVTLASYLATSANERSRWRKEQYVRWANAVSLPMQSTLSPLRRRHTVTFKLRPVTVLMFAHSRFTIKADQEPESSKEIEVERSARWEKILLLGDQAEELPCRAAIW